MAWILHIDLRPEISDWKAGKLTIPQLADKVAIRLLTSQWDKLTPYPDTLRDHIAWMREAADEWQYQDRWEPLYDVANADEVWIETGV